MEAQRTFIAQRHPRGDIGAAFFEQAVACGVPQGHAHTLIPVRGSGIDGPNFTGGLARLFIARAVETDEADDLVAVDGDLNLGFAKFDGFAPIGLAFFYRRDRKSTRLNSSHLVISYAVFCLKKKKT